MSTQTIAILREDGQETYYRTLSARLPAFLAQYGPAQGYAVEITATDTLALQPGLLKLYETAIAAGQAPERVGLPPLAEPRRSVVFQARLRDADGRIVATASALKPVLGFKDWEAGETAARQRLLAALGFGGEVLDDDETADQAMQGLHTAVLPDAEPAPTPTPVSEPAVPEESAIPVALVRQIAFLAQAKGQAVSGYRTATEAREVLKRLMRA